MDETKLKTIEFKVNNALQLRNNCVNIVVLLTGGIIGLILSELNFLKSVFIVIGTLILVFIFLIAFVTDKDIDSLIKEMEQ